MMNKTTLGKRISFTLPTWYRELKENKKPKEKVIKKSTPTRKNSITAHKLYKYEKRLEGKKRKGVLSSQRLYCSLMSDLNLYIANRIVNDGIRFNMPYNVGSLFVIGSKVTYGLDDDGKVIGKPPIDWKTTNEYNKKLKEGEKKKIFYHFNEHSDGFTYRIKFLTHKKNSLFRARISYHMKKALSKRVLESPILPFRKI